MTRIPAALSVVGIVALVVLGACGCGGGGPAPPQATVTGRVLDDASLQPVSNARVSVGFDSTTTNASGFFSLQTAPGSRNVQVSNQGYQTLTFSHNVQVGTNSLGILYLRPALQWNHGAASGVVRYGAAPVPGAVVYCGGAEATCKSDGSYAIYNLPAGQRALFGHDPGTDRVGYVVVTVVAGQTTPGANIVLNLTPPARPRF